MLKSPLKMAGSKTRLLETIIALIHDVPEQYKTPDGQIKYYVEPFLGSATVALNVNAQQLFLSDFNQDLVDVANCCLIHKNQLLEEMGYIWDLDLVGGKYNADKYYEIRAWVQDHQAMFAPYEVEEFTYYVARFLYLNKFGFNGLIRYTKRTNKFNTPVGAPSSKINPKVPSMPIEQILDYGFSGVASIKQKGYVEAFEHILNDPYYLDHPCVFYCDPPYVKADDVISAEIVYGQNGFTMEDQSKLAELANLAASQGHTVLISNHRTSATEELYNGRYGAELVDMPEVNRSISCKGGDRKHLKEIVAIFRPNK